MRIYSGAEGRRESLEKVKEKLWKSLGSVRRMVFLLLKADPGAGAGWLWSADCVRDLRGVWELKAL